MLGTMESCPTYSCPSPKHSENRRSTLIDADGCGREEVDSGESDSGRSAPDDRSGFSVCDVFREYSGSAALYLARPRLTGSRIRENSEAGWLFSPKSHDFGYNEMSHSGPRTVYLVLVKSDLRKPIAFAIVLAMLLLSRLVWHRLDLRRAAAKNSLDALRKASTPTTATAAVRPSALRR